jgi:hypothetical protein
MSRKPALFNEALAGFFRSTAATANARAEAGHAPSATAAARSWRPSPRDNPLADASTSDAGSDSDWLRTEDRDPTTGPPDKE